MVLENLKNNETVKKGVDFFLKTTIMGGAIIGLFLVMEKTIGFGFELSISFGI